MTKSTKALLLSALVYPGAGQVFLKRYTIGIIMIGITSVGLYLVLENTFKITFQIIEKIQNGEAQPNFSTLLGLVSQHDTQLLNNAVTIMVITWLVSIVHLYIISKNNG